MTSRTTRLFAATTALTAIVALAPTLSSAAPAAAGNCMKALVDSLSTKVKVVDSRYIDKGMHGYDATKYTVVAKRARTGEAIAQATCLVDKSGEVVELHQDMPGTLSAIL